MGMSAGTDCLVSPTPGVSVSGLFPSLPARCRAGHWRLQQLANGGIAKQDRRLERAQLERRRLPPALPGLAEAFALDLGIDDADFLGERKEVFHADEQIGHNLRRRA